VSTAGTYTLNVTDSNNCWHTDDVIVTETAAPTAIPSSNSPVCEGDTIELYGDPAIGVTYSWTGPDGFTSPDQNPTISGATAAKAGNYYLTVDDGTCISDPVATYVTVDPCLDQVDLSLEKNVDNATPYVGDTVIFTVEVINDGPSNATNVDVEDILPGCVSYVLDYRHYHCTSTSELRHYCHGDIRGQLY